jgi:hypothetical protein
MCKRRCVTYCYTIKQQTNLVQPGAHQAPSNGYRRSFRGINRPGRDADHPLPKSIEVSTPPSPVSPWDLKEISLTFIEDYQERRIFEYVVFNIPMTLQYCVSFGTTESALKGQFRFTSLWPCIVNAFKYNQQAAKLHNGIYYCKSSTCFRWFLHPSSGAQNRVFVAIVSELGLQAQLTHDTGKKQKKLEKYRCFVYFWAPDDGQRNRLKYVEHLQ